jgi:hypothetical protein
MNRSLAFGLVSVLGAASLAHASNIDPLAYGSNLAGATVSIDYFNTNGLIGTRSGVFVDIGSGAGQAIVPDPFGGVGFVRVTVRGDTFDPSVWLIENFADAFIGRALYDLTTCSSVFDDSDANPDTPGSAAGRDSIIFDPISTAPLHLLADEQLSWTGAKNAGDLWWQEFITWPVPTPAGGPGFGPNQFFRYSDDTDIVPAPGAAFIVGLGGLLAARRRR